MIPVEVVWGGVGTDRRRAREAAGAAGAPLRRSRGRGGGAHAAAGQKARRDFRAEINFLTGGGGAQPKKYCMGPGTMFGALT